MKLISVSVHCYNEEKNIVPLAQAIIQEFETNLPNYNYEIQFIDNDSTDNTQNIIRELCLNNPKIKAIFNAKNFEYRSGYYGLLQTKGDCSISMASDFQDPPELITKFVKAWEKGAMIVCGIKSSSKENKLMYFIRSLYYSLIQKFSSVQQIEHFTGFGLYDKKFLDFVRELNEPIPYMRGIVAEYGYNIEKVFFEQPKRKAGKSKNKIYNLYDIAMRGLTTYTKVGVRIASLGGMFFSVFSVLVAFVYLILKLIYWDSFPTGIAPIIIGMFLIGSVQTAIIGLLGEYVLTINTRVMNRPLVLEKERLNFDEEDTNEIC